jgi:hypothetical protein
MRRRQPQAFEVPGGPPVVRAPGAEALHETLRNLASTGEAFRLGIIGVTGTGKTFAARKVIAAYVRVSPGLVVVVDAKAEGRFDDVLPVGLVAVRRSISELAPGVLPLAPGVRMLIIRPRMFEGERVDVEEVARYCWRLAGRHTPTLLVNDELVPHAAEFSQFLGGKKSDIKRCFAEGRVHGLSQLWGTQDLTDVPITVVAQSSSIWTFKTAGTGLEILRRRGYLLGVPDGVIENLPDDDNPPDERGDFVRLRAGKRWDSKLYRF